MWFEDNDQYVRAPTPEGFNKLVQALEDNDSVLFESISLPSSKTNTKPVNDYSPTVNTSQEMVVPKLNIDLNIEDDFTDEDDFMEMTDVTERDPQILQDELAELEMESARKDEIIRQKDEQILMLQKELDQLLKGKGSKIPRPATVNCRISESAEFYKDKYNKVLNDFESLKESLSADGKLRVVSSRSARAFKPEFDI